MRRVAKRTLFSIAWLAVSPLSLVCWLEKSVSKSEHAFLFCAQGLAILPGFLGSLFRSAFYSASLTDCSWETTIGFGSFFSHRSAIVGRHTSLGAYCVLGHVRLGNNIMIGSKVSVPSGKRQHFSESGRLVDQTIYEEVTIGDGCWIGEGAIVLADVGRHSVVSAGAVVVSSFGEQCLIGGNPARCIRSVEV